MIPINDLTITVIPIAIDDEIPLFGEQQKDIQLKHTKTKVFDFGFAQSTYEINKKPNSQMAMKHQTRWN